MTTVGSADQRDARFEAFENSHTLPRLSALSAEHRNNLGWLTDGATTTTGNNVDASFGYCRANGAVYGRASRIADIHFTTLIRLRFLGGALGSTILRLKLSIRERSQFIRFGRTDYRRAHQLGFTEAARNFQRITSDETPV